MTNRSVRNLRPADQARTARAALVVGALTALLGAACTGSPPPPLGPSSTRSVVPPGTIVPASLPAPSASPGNRPNILVILTDDQVYNEAAGVTPPVMPTVQAELRNKGMTFSRSFFVNPLCCPSRTTILTGRYSHSTGVYRNDPPFGGFETFGSEDRSTIAVWLHRAGYATAMVGKYLNGYKNGSYVPPGWDVWNAFVRVAYYDFSLSVNGHTVEYGQGRKNYSTDVLSKYAVDFIHSVPRGRPLFLYFAPKAPHAPATPPPRYAKTYLRAAPLHPPNFNEADVSDKPRWVRSLPRLTPDEQQAEDVFRQHQLGGLKGVDDAVGRILGALRAAGRLSTTFILFSSDNGLELGSHRWMFKGDPYEASIRDDLIIRYDPITRLRPSTNDRFALNVDFAPTLAAVGRVRAPGVEGVSLLPLLEGRSPAWRSDFLIEHMTASLRGPPTFCAVRNDRYLFVEYRTHEEELYDLTSDPFELTNRVHDPTLGSVVTRMKARVRALCSPLPPGFPPL